MTQTQNTTAVHMTETQIVATLIRNIEDCIPHDAHATRHDMDHAAVALADAYLEATGGHARAGDGNSLPAVFLDGTGADAETDFSIGTDGSTAHTFADGSFAAAVGRFIVTVDAQGFREAISFWSPAEAEQVLLTEIDEWEDEDGE